MDPKEIVKGVAPLIVKEVDEKVEAGIESVKEDLKAEGEETAKSIKGLEESMAKIETASKQIAFKNDEAGKEKLAKQAIVNIVKGIRTKGISTEAQFKSHFDSVVKETFQNTGATGTPATGEGAEFVFEQFERGVHAVFAEFPLVAELNTLQLATGKSITLPTYDGGVEAYWLDEGADFTASKAGTGTIKVDIYKLGALVSLTDEMLEDDMTVETLYSLIVREAGTKFAMKIEDGVLNGNATTGKLKGILTASGIKNHTSAATSVAALSDVDFATADGMVDEKYDINEGNKVAIMRKATRNALMVARDANGALIFPDFKTTGQIFGFRAVTARSMPDATTGNVAVLIGNVKDFYRHVSRKGFTAEMGHIDGDFQAGKKTVRMERRDGGQPIEAEAFATITLG